MIRFYADLDKTNQEIESPVAVTEVDLMEYDRLMEGVDPNDGREQA
jgi:hypothetical protein